MTRTLSQHQPEPYAEMHPATAARYGILQDNLVRLETIYGDAIARARLTDTLPPDALVAE